MKLDDLVKSLVTRAGVIRVKTAVNAALWAMIPLIALLVASAYLIGPNSWVSVFGAFMVFGGFALFAFSYLYFLFNDPDRLQSDEYRLAHQQLTLQRKGEPPVVITGRPDEGGPTIEMEAEPSNSEGD